MTGLVTYERRGHVAILSLDDEKRRNALSSAMVRDALALLEKSRSDGARSIVIASAQRWFCAGADVSDMLESGWLEKTVPDAAIPTPLDLFAALDAERRPVIAAVDGLTLGGGVELTLVCDLTVASEGVEFVFPELGLGVVPNTALARLPALIGLRATRDLLLTRRRLKAAEAYAMGLVSRLVPAGEVLQAAVDLAEEIVNSCPPAAIAAVRKGTRPTGWGEIWGLLGLMDRGEWQEGISAFLEKRQPDYGRFWAGGRKDGGT